ncbi:response regulator receiver modulated diguanylate cyclase/phosphodiesterase with PAS/PAC sensor(s) [Gluconacetobacter diazotrophicus PA1 5]|uniref:putative bifunctional diguanylate cyclase/phosphodiesterase n=1 Tax=Gluconacetobacter diazotrophicus TaxID=33996 RepID=UPI000173CFC9|nr:EAL domain-containing protein [Gluconacetobacter diazotrophicus]ACI50967.1 response regulator receiver modulated diguanylate cyclase/phosphodiesterase with PAS/PAC sensor(s) [Gluconacetobacter diazotrophicus PA1 5]TWB08578.1 PAS domain S-box-containing protein/diguanylate cyclase (GGDEF)-like protein [Gluconacetobacter diazotrophicus]
MRLVVVVDDGSATRTILARMAMTLGADIQVEAFASPIEALDWFGDTNIPDLVIADCRMPMMDGAAFTARIRALGWGGDVPVMVVTAQEDREGRISALAAGATDFLSSPVDHTEFLTRARNLLQLGWHQKRARSPVQLEQELENSRAAQAEILRGSRDRLLQVIDTVPALVSATDAEGNYIFVNRFHARVMGAGQGRNDAASQLRDRQVLETGLPTARYEESIADRYGMERILLTSKIPFYDDASGMRYVLTTSLDITDRKKAERELHHLAYYDQLTGLPSRSKLETEMQVLLRQRGADGPPFAFVLMDLDRFKGINDTQGHTIGDLLLRKVALRLRTALPRAGIIARLGGDEFAIVHDVIDAADAAHMAERIVGIFARPFTLGDRVTSVGASAGVTLFPARGATFETLLKRADLAMYRAKNEGRCRYAFFDEEMEQAFAATTELEQALRRAVENEEFVLHYQPQIDLASGTLCGVEALIRWVQPGGDLVHPGCFLPLAEETGLIAPMTVWSLREACRQAARWQSDGIHIRVAVNLSGVLFRQHDVHRLVVDATTEAGLDPSFLELELTETAVIENPESAGRQLAALQQMGVSVAIDDFGTGYASLVYLTRLPIHRLKIDRVFIQDLGSSPGSRAIVKAIIALGKNLGIRVIAEGIERQDQLRWLEEQDCQEAQGFYFGYPVPPAKLQDLVDSGTLMVP